MFLNRTQAAGDAIKCTFTYSAISERKGSNKILMLLISVDFSNINMMRREGTAVKLSYYEAGVP